MNSGRLTRSPRKLGSVTPFFVSVSAERGLAYCPAMRPTRMIGFFETVQEHEAHLQQDLQLLRDQVRFALGEASPRSRRPGAGRPGRAGRRRGARVSASISHDTTIGGSFEQLRHDVLEMRRILCTSAAAGRAWPASQPDAAEWSREIA